MRLVIKLPPSRREQKSLVILRAAYEAKPGREKRAIRKALKKFKKGGKAA